MLAPLGGFNRSYNLKKGVSTIRQDELLTIQQNVTETNVHFYYQSRIKEQVHNLL